MCFVIIVCSQQISELKKENFGLKLRIYFLEERVNQNGDVPEDIFKAVRKIFVLFLIVYTNLMCLFLKSHSMNLVINQKEQLNIYKQVTLAKGISLKGLHNIDRLDPINLKYLSKTLVYVKFIRVFKFRN